MVKKSAEASDLVGELVTRKNRGARQPWLSTLPRPGKAMRCDVAQRDQAQASLNAFRLQPEGVASVHIEEREVALAVVKVTNGRSAE